MSFSLHLLILCVLQGITEFIPVSSSAHLMLLPKLFGWQDPGHSVDVILHLGTLLTVLVYFHSDIWQMTKSVLRYATSGRLKLPKDSYLTLAFSIIAATLPAIIIGYCVKRIGMDRFSGPVYLGINSIIFGVLLYLADQFGKNDQKDFSIKKGFLIGMAQSVALIPGVSRSGICITAARLLGFDKIKATRYAFLLSIPTVLGATTLTIWDMYKEGVTLPIAPLAMGVVFTAIIGLCVIHAMMLFLARFNFTVFMLYRVLLGALILLCV